MLRSYGGGEGRGRGCQKGGGTHIHHNNVKPSGARYGYGQKNIYNLEVGKLYSIHLDDQPLFAYQPFCLFLEIKNSSISKNYDILEFIEKNKNNKTIPNEIVYKMSIPDYYLSKSEKHAIKNGIPENLLVLSKYMTPFLYCTYKNLKEQNEIKLEKFIFYNVILKTSKKNSTMLVI